MTRAKVITIFGLCALAFNNWLLGLALNHHLIFAGGSISELSALTQAYHQVFRWLDVLSGILFITCAAIIFGSATSTVKRAMVYVLAITGVAQVVDALMAMPCSGTVDQNCVVPVNLSLSHFYIPPHTYSSMVLGVCFLVMPILGLLIKTSRRFFWYLSLITILVTLAFFGILLGASQNGYFVANAAVGLSQEIQMLILGLWLTTLPVFWSSSKEAFPVGVQTNKSQTKLAAVE
jgi:hypothetical protein